MTKGKAIFISIDQLINTIFNGWPDETISSRAWRWHIDNKRSWPYKFIDTIFFWEDKHCYNSYISEREGKQLPPELR